LACVSITRLAGIPEFGEQPYAGCMIDEGAIRYVIYNKIGGMDRQTLRDWVHRFNAAGPRGPHRRLDGGVPSLPCRRSNGPSLRRSSRPGRIVRRTASCGGGGSTSSASSLRGSASTFTRAMSESSEEARLFPHEQNGRISAPSPITVQQASRLAADWRSSDRSGASKSRGCQATGKPTKSRLPLTTKWRQAIRLSSASAYSSH